MHDYSCGWDWPCWSAGVVPKVLILRINNFEGFYKNFCVSFKYDPLCWFKGNLDLWESLQGIWHENGSETVNLKRGLNQNFLHRSWSVWHFVNFSRILENKKCSVEVHSKANVGNQVSPKMEFRLKSYEKLKTVYKFSFRRRANHFTLIMQFHAKYSTEFGSKRQRNLHSKTNTLNQVSQELDHPLRNCCILRSALRAQTAGLQKKHDEPEGWEFSSHFVVI